MRWLRDPLRLSDVGSSAPAGLAAGIRELRAEHGSPEQVTQLDQRIASQLAAPAATSTSAVGVGAGSKWLLLGVLASLGSVFYAADPPVRVEKPVATPTAEFSPPAEAQPQQAPAGAIPDSALPGGLEPPAAEPARALRRRPQPGQRAGRPARSAHDELALLKRSQNALDREPAAALAFAEQHAREYPRGLFAQEREILAIEALLKLRRKPQALDRTQRFMARFPDSPHARRARALLDRTHAPADAAMPAPAAD
jgi:hypothetical protein